MKQRIDLWLVQEGYFQSREQAQRSIMAGEVTVNGKRIEKSSQIIQEPITVAITSTGQAYASRGGYKLEKAVRVFQIEVSGKICMDAGASTGGFTDFLLQNGASHVYAVDVGYGQLAWKLRQDTRVTVFERENIRYFSAAKLDTPPQLITADLSFISLELVFQKFSELIQAGGDLITLIKPQFEAGKEKVGKKGVVRDKKIHLEVVERLANNAPHSGWHMVNLTYSPILGPEGNIEYLGHWKSCAGAQDTGSFYDFDKVIQEAWLELRNPPTNF